MVVWNTFQNDARVLKEAETLSGHGYAVTVFALHTPGVTRQHETLAGGVRVVRVVRSPRMALRNWWRSKRRASTAGEQSSPGPAVEPVAEGPVRGYRLALQVVSRALTHMALVIAMIRSRPDIVHAHDVNTLATAWIAARLSRAKLIYDAHEISTDREGYQSIRRWVGALERCLVPRADGMITTTDTRAKFFARAYGVSRPLVLQNRPRRIERQANDRLRRELGLPDDRPIVLYQGGLQAGRGLEDLVQSARDVPGAFFVLIGSGRLERTLRGLVDEFNLSARVFFIPTVPLAGLLGYTMSADIGVQPIRNTCLNHFSTDSNKLFEYVMAGLPVVASDLPEIRRIVRRYDLGLLFDAETPGALAAALATLVDSPELRSRYAANASMSADTLAWESQEDTLVALYQGVAPPGPGRLADSTPGG